MDRKHCSGCEDDFYNGKNPYGVTECWCLKNAVLGTYKLIPVDLSPPYTHIKAEKLPVCYRRKRYVKREAPDA